MSFSFCRSLRTAPQFVMNGLLKDMRRARFHFQSIQNPTQPVSHSYRSSLFQHCSYQNVHLSAVGLLITWRQEKHRNLSTISCPNLLIDTFLLFWYTRTDQTELTADTKKCLSKEMQKHFLCLHFLFHPIWI